MKIAIVMDQLYKSGGIEKLIATKANYWVEKCNYEVIIITHSDTELPPFYSMNSKVENVNLSLKYRKNKPLLSYYNIKEAIYHLNKLRQSLKNNKPDIVIMCGFGVEFFFLPFITKAKTIKENHSSRIGVINKSKTGLFSKLKYISRVKLESFYDAMVTLSEEECSLHKGSNLSVIANPIEKIHLPKCNKRFNKVITAGRITPLKGFDRLIEIWSLVNHKVTGWSLHIFGSGDENYIKTLNDLILDLGLKDSVFIEGETNKLTFELQQSSIFVMASYTECFPMVILEAMQASLPVISFDCPTGPRNIVKDKVTGYLIDDNNNEVFAKSLQKLMRDEVLRDKMGIAALTEVDKYTEDNILKLWNQLFIQVLN